MQSRPFLFELLLLASMLSGCGFPDPLPGTDETATALVVRGMNTPEPGSGGFLFAETDETRNLPPEAHIIRYRFVKVRLDILMDDSGQAREIGKVVANLFPDVIHTAVIQNVTQEGDGYTWSGYLEGVDYSYFTMVYTSGVFMGHFASPNGIYEVVYVEGDLYRVIMIDQTKFQGGEG